MPQDNPRNDNQRSDNSRAEAPRGDRARAEKSSAANAMNSPFGDIGTRSMTAGLRLQKEMLDVLQGISREWLSRASSEAELALQLPNKLTAARTMPDAFSAYQEWLIEWMAMRGEDGRRLISDSYKILDTGVRCLVDTAPAVTS